MLNQNELDEIRRKLRELEEEPPIAGWQNIQKELKPRKRWRLFWWIPLAVLLLVGTGVLIVQNRKNDTGKILLKAPQSAKTIAGKQLDNKKIASGLKPSKPTRAPLSQSAKKNNFKSQQSLVGRNPSGITANATAKKKTGTKVLDKSGTNKMAFSTATKAEKTPNNQLQGEIFKKAVKPEAEIINTNTPEKENLLNAGTDNNKPLPTDSMAQATQPDSVTIAKQEKTSKKKEELAPEPKKRKPESWSLSVFFAPRYAFRVLTPNTQDEILITRMNQINKLDPKRMGYEYGLNAAKTVTPKMQVEVGLSLMQLKEDVAYSFTNGAVDSSSLTSVLAPDGSLTVTTGYVLEERQLTSTYTYGGLRLGTTYYFGSSARHRYNVTFAAGANLLVKGRTKQYINGTWTETITFPSRKNILEQSNYHLLLGAGYNVQLSPQFEFMVMPAINYFLGSTYKKREPFGLRPYSFGITFQVKKIFE